MNPKLKEKTLESLSALLPITGIVLFIGFLMGVIITVSEPDMQVLAQQVPSIPNMVLILTVAVGVGPILAVLVLGCFFKPTGADYSLGEVATVETTRDVVRVFLHELPEFAGEVLISLFPIVAVFIIFQLITHRYQKRHIKE